MIFVSISLNLCRTYIRDGNYKTIQQKYAYFAYNIASGRQLCDTKYLGAMSNTDVCVRQVCKKGYHSADNKVNIQVCENGQHFTDKVDNDFLCKEAAIHIIN